MKLSPIIAALEDAWDQIRLLHPEVPFATITVSNIRKCSGWSQGQHVVIAFSALQDPEWTVGTLIHEAVHQALKHQEGHIKRSHSKIFRDKAIEFGLDDEQHQPRLGTAALTSTTRDLYYPFIKRLEELT